MNTKSGSKLGLFLKSLVALLAGAIVPALVIALLFTLSFARDRGTDLDAPSTTGAYLAYLLGSAGIAFLFAFVFTAAFAFVLGLPLALIMMRFRLVRWWSCILAGSLIGFLPSLWASWPDLQNALIVGGGLGAIGGLTAWLVWHFWAGRAPAPQTPLPVEPVSGPPASA